MHFIKTPDSNAGRDDLLKRLRTELQTGQKVLWLIPGGSNISISVEIMSALESPLTAHLSVLLTDERYGPIGHPDSSAWQLDQAGFVPKEAAVIPVLVAGLDLNTTRAHYEDVALQAFAQADFILGQFGIGADGHIAGILPQSAATTTPDFVAGYNAGEFQRLTLTAHALKRLSAAYALVFGSNKAEALERLHDEMVPYAEQPAQILKELPEAYVYNDQIGDTP